MNESELRKEMNAITEYLRYNKKLSWQEITIVLAGATYNVSTFLNQYSMELTVKDGPKP